ncbi:MAG: nucleotide exchange factor GrpE [Lachnospiraceae bacterium]|nr:nucleotide exchange factor GrpE [Lachnospiraceae bacterium]
MSKEKAIKIDIESPEDEAIKDEEITQEITEESAKEPEEVVEADAAEAEQQADEQEAEDKPEESEGDKKKHFGKKKDKKDPKDERIAELEDRVKRQMAEFENFRKRTDKEKSGMYDMGAKNVIEKILPVIDNFERGLENIPEGSDAAFADGMKMIYKQLATELDKLGVKPIEAVGQPFDPNFHNAVMQVESEEYESGTVAAELQKGYMYHDTLVRPSMVSVVQ